MASFFNAEEVVRQEMEAFRRFASGELPCVRPQTTADRYPHYFRTVQHLAVVDVYRILELWGVGDPCLQHAIKKLLVAGGRGAKPAAVDVKEAIATLERWLEMRDEDAALEKGLGPPGAQP